MIGGEHLGGRQPSRVFVWAHFVRGRWRGRSEAQTSTCDVTPEHATKAGSNELYGRERSECDQEDVVKTQLRCSLSLPFAAHFLHTAVSWPEMRRMGKTESPGEQRCTLISAVPCIYRRDRQTAGLERTSCSPALCSTPPQAGAMRRLAVHIACCEVREEPLLSSRMVAQITATRPKRHLKRRESGGYDERRSTRTTSNLGLVRAYSPEFL